MNNNSKFIVCFNCLIVNQPLAIVEVTSYTLNQKMEQLLGKDLISIILFKEADKRIIQKLPQYHAVLFEHEPCRKNNLSLCVKFQIKFQNCEYMLKFMSDYSNQQ